MVITESLSPAPINKAKSVVFTNEGLARSERLVADLNDSAA